MAGTWEAEVAVIGDLATAFQPGDRARLYLKNQNSIFESVFEGTFGLTVLFIWLMKV